MYKPKESLVEAFLRWLFMGHGSLGQDPLDEMVQWDWDPEHEDAQ